MCCHVKQKVFTGLCSHVKNEIQPVIQWCVEPPLAAITSSNCFLYDLNSLTLLWNSFGPLCGTSAL